MPVDQGFLCCFIEEADIELCFRVQDESCSAVAVREPEHGCRLTVHFKHTFSDNQVGHGCAGSGDGGTQWRNCRCADGQRFQKMSTMHGVSLDLGRHADHVVDDCAARGHEVVRQQIEGFKPR